jgi:hypothetical protein
LKSSISLSQEIIVAEAERRLLGFIEQAGSIADVSKILAS